AGTDIMSLRSEAVEVDAGFRLHARKASITNIGVADVALCSARLRDVPVSESINIFAVPTQRDGVRVTPIRDMVGLRTSCTGHLDVDGATLPSTHLIGSRGAGVAIFRLMFSLERLLTAYLYLGALRYSLERGFVQANEREQFGKAIGRNQYVQGKLVDMRVSEHLLSLHLRDCCRAWTEGEAINDTLSISKIFGVEAALQASRDLIQLLGARGVRRGELAEKFHRDLLALSILGGTVELQKIVVYNDLVRARAPKRSLPRTESGQVTVTRLEEGALREVETELVELTRMVFPDESSLDGRYYYDSKPHVVVVARTQGQLAGFRTLHQREIVLHQRSITVVGTGIAVHPSFRSMGIGALLTEEAIALAKERGADLAVAFLFARSSESLLRKCGFQPLRVRVTYENSVTGELEEERMPGYALDLRGGSFLEEIENSESLHLGVGVW
ncbi:MAG: GNAT family N-acetyltransferase, partial [Myxococcota bacterium]